MNEFLISNALQTTLRVLKIGKANENVSARVACQNLELHPNLLVSVPLPNSLRSTAESCGVLILPSSLEIAEDAMVEEVLVA